MKKIQLQVEKREMLGRKIKRLRKEGILPANIYGKKVKSQAIQVDMAVFHNIYKEAGETGIVYLTLDKGKIERPVLIHNVQRDPVKDIFLHVDFHQIDLKEKVTAAIPVEIKGKAPAEDKGLVLLTLLDEIEVEALPADLPDKFEVDVSKLKEVNQGISIKDLEFSRDKVKPLVESEEELIVKINEPSPEEEEKPEIAPEGETPEGEAAPEGETSEGRGKAPEGEKEAKTGEAKKEETKPADKKPEKKETPAVKPDKK